MGSLTDNIQDNDIKDELNDKIGELITRLGNKEVSIKVIK